jgi:hypothetical protein
MQTLHASASAVLARIVFVLVVRLMLIEPRDHENTWLAGPMAVAGKSGIRNRQAVRGLDIKT